MEISGAVLEWFTSCLFLLTRSLSYRLLNMVYLRGQFCVKLYLPYTVHASPRADHL